MGAEAKKKSLGKKTPVWNFPHAGKQVDWKQVIVKLLDMKEASFKPQALKERLSFSALSNMIV